MAKQFNDQVDVLDGDGETTITLDANAGTLAAGDHGKTGGLELKDRVGNERVRLHARGTLTIRDTNGDAIVEIDGAAGRLLFRDADGNEALRYLSERGSLELGAAGNDGHLRLRNDDGATVFTLDGSRAEFVLGHQGAAGTAGLKDVEGETAIELEAESATLSLGREGNGGGLKLISETGGLAFQVTGDFARMRGALTLGGRDKPGLLTLMDPMGRPAMYADGGSAKLQLGNIGNAADLALLDNAAEPILEFDGLTATTQLGGNTKPGLFILRDGEGEEVGRLSASGASLFLGAVENGGEILVLDDEGKSSFSVDGANSTVVVGRGRNRVILDGSNGDIQLAGADCAEEFRTPSGAEIEPGSVLVVTSELELRPCDREYDSRVAGVVSGASGLRPGIVLNRGTGSEDRSPVALNGRVSCKVDASRDPIEIGDLLTTSDLPGHAMKACDRERAFGSVLGKALAPLEGGRGFVPILVSLL